MIAPLAAMPIRGALWYQGESDALPNRQKYYVQALTGMITDWRMAWAQPNLPFLIVQLPNLGKPDPLNAGGWPQLRAAQAEVAANLPHTWMAVTIDGSEGDNLHPTKKQILGSRLALLARHEVYNEHIADSGPVFKDCAVDQGRIIVHFRTGDGALVAAADGAVHGCVIAGADRKFVLANARIDGDTLVVWSDQVLTPREVRYAWADNPEANLHNADGLAAAPFCAEIQ